MLKGFTLLGLSLMGLISSAGGADFYVSGNGNDEAAGSKDAPFASISRAAAVAGPGDTVHIGPGLYREQINFTRSGQEGAPIVFQGSRGEKQEFQSIVEPDGQTLTQWQEAPEIAPMVWKTALPQRPELVMIDGKMMGYINRQTMALPAWEQLPEEISEDMLWSKFGPECKRLPGLDLLRLPAGILVKHRYFGERKELFWPALGDVLSGWQDGTFYIRFANASRPEQHQITVVSGNGFVVNNQQHLIFRDLHLRGSRCQIELTGPDCARNTIERCLLMHGGRRIWLRDGAHHNLIRDNILTSGFVQSETFKLRAADDMRGGLMYLIFKYIIGTSSSDDIGVYVTSPDNVIKDNFILQGLIGIDAFAPGLECSGNVIREMSSVGLCTGNGTTGRFHHNIYANCGIPLRIHNLRHSRAERLEYHYCNLLIQKPGGGSQIYVHCESHLPQFADAENFDLVEGKYVYKAEPPNPVDAGKIHIYHNTLYGGSSTPFTVNYLFQRFRAKMPFFFANNIACATWRISPGSQELMAGNLYYHLADSKPVELREPAVLEHNLVLPPEQFNS
ncbi:MAG: DUF1565 domain-containing protein, partial [Oligosphaeraceae bacterium]|nr:DUF1565 domain-containing protein [Oligosphaeraceae bacterium]